MESPWDDDPQITREAEWTKISSEFTNTGYREGITVGKEAALQEGFNDGFVHVGAPLGRELGILRGISSAILTFLTSTRFPTTPKHDSMMTETRDIAHQLANICFTDMAPRDLEAESHAREHLELDVHDKLTEKQKLEGIGDSMLAKMSAGPNGGETQKVTMEGIRILKKQINTLRQALGLGVDNLTI